MSGLALSLVNRVPWQRKPRESCLADSHDAPRRAESPQPSTHDALAPGEDLALAEGCRSGNLASFERLYQLQGARMKSVAMNLLGNAHDAEDVVQEVFLKVHRNIASFRGQSAFSTWMYRILLNACYDLRRKRMRRQELPELEPTEDAPAPEPPAPMSNHPLRLALERAVAELRPTLRSVFLLFEVEGFRHSEIAAMLQITETSSKNALYQAKQELRRILSSSRGDERMSRP